MDQDPAPPENFRQFQARFADMFAAYEEGARLARASGPLDEVTSHLVQLAAAIAIRSQGAVHSHTRRALAAGASPEAIFQVVNLLISTVGFPNAAAGFSWINDVVGRNQR
ncbi:MAG: carboxymuconolactone decarboxylase family protein [Thermodesulfobacteriota bacterium]